MTSKTFVDRRYSKYIIFCKCGCGETLSLYNRWGYKRDYIKDHKGKSQNQKGSNNNNYKGGWINEQGYHNTGRKNICVHRRVYEEYYKCCLLPWIDIHHKDGNKLNNHISNLEPLLHPIHLSIHKSKPEIFVRLCLVCGQGSYVKHNGRPSWTKYGNGFRCMKCYLKEYRYSYN